MKKSCTALKVHLYWPISTQISSASCGKNRNFRDSQQIAWLKKSSQVERLCSAKSKAVKRRASHLIWPVKARGIYIALFPCHGVLLFSCVFFSPRCKGEQKGNQNSEAGQVAGWWLQGFFILPPTRVCFGAPLQFSAGDQPARNLPQKWHLQRHLAEETDKP